MLGFYVHDITPALRARRKAPGDDILSELIARRASWRMILTECMTYAAAGMVTTREFIVMAAWHLFERPELRADFLAGDEARQFASTRCSGSSRSPRCCTGASPTRAP